nr:hypothetical protein [Tanacetum cinerariifolium]
VATMQVKVQFLQQLQLEWSRFVTIVKQNHNLDTVSYHKLFDIIKQYQKEVNEIHAERIAKNANPLALVATAQQYLDTYYQAPKSHKSYAPPSKQSSSTISNASIKYKAKEIAKPIRPPSESSFEEDSDPEQAQRDKNMQKSLASIAKYKNDNQTRRFANQRTMTVAGARETVGSQVVRQTGIQCFNYKEFGHLAKECWKPKRVKDYAYHKEKMLLCKQVEKGVPLQAEQADWLEDTDEDIDEQELEAHYSYMAKFQEVPTVGSGTDTEPLEKVQYDAEYNVFANERQHSEPESINNTCVVEKTIQLIEVTTMMMIPLMMTTRMMRLQRRKRIWLRPTLLLHQLLTLFPLPRRQETDPFETDESATTPRPPPVDHTTPLGARISIQPRAPLPFLLEVEAERLLALPTPPPGIIIIVVTSISWIVYWTILRVLLRILLGIRVSNVTVRHNRRKADPQQRSRHQLVPSTQGTLDLEHNLEKAEPALAPQGPTRV